MKALFNIGDVMALDTGQGWLRNDRCWCLAMAEIHLLRFLSERRGPYGLDVIPLGVATPRHDTPQSSSTIRYRGLVLRISLGAERIRALI